MSDNGSLKTLHTALIDAKNGYEAARKRAETPEIGAVFKAMIALHERSHGDVHRILTARGEKADDAGSFMSTVHETVVKVRSAVVGIDENSLSAFASGEERNAKKFDEAIADNASDPTSAEVLTRHRTALAEMIIKMKAAAGLDP